MFCGKQFHDIEIPSTTVKIPWSPNICLLLLTYWLHEGKKFGLFCSLLCSPCFEQKLDHSVLLSNQYWLNLKWQNSYIFIFHVRNHVNMLSVLDPSHLEFSVCTFPRINNPPHNYHMKRFSRSPPCRCSISQQGYSKFLMLMNISILNIIGCTDFSSLGVITTGYLLKNVLLLKSLWALLWLSLFSARASHRNFRFTWDVTPDMLSCEGCYESKWSFISSYYLSFCFW